MCPGVTLHSLFCLHGRRSFPWRIQWCICSRGGRLLDKETRIWGPLSAMKTVWLPCSSTKHRSLLFLYSHQRPPKMAGGTPLNGRSALGDSHPRRNTRSNQPCPHYLNSECKALQVPVHQLFISERMSTNPKSRVSMEMVLPTAPPKRASVFSSICTRQ